MFRIELVPIAGVLGGDHARHVAQQRERGEADVFAHALHRLITPHAHDRDVTRPGRVDVMLSTPAPLLTISRRPGNAASRPGVGRQVNT